MELRGAKYGIDGFMSSFATLLKEGKRRFLIRCYSPLAEEFLAKASDMRNSHDFSFIVFDKHKNASHKEPYIEVIPSHRRNFNETVEYDAALVFTEANFRKVLLEFINCPKAAVVVCKNKYDINTFVSSAPKSGTHLLLELLKHFGYSIWRKFEIKSPSSFAYHRQMFTLSHYFHDSIDRFAQLKSAERRFFFKHPMIVIYRDPRDHLVSRYHQIMRDKVYPWHLVHWLKTKDQQILKLIEGIKLGNGYELVPDYRNYIWPYVSWLDLEEINVVAVKFEDLVGPSGGGDHEAQNRTVWKLQLALNVPGNSEEFSERTYNTDSQTFRVGQIGSHKGELNQVHYDALATLPQDFMEKLGYR